MKISHLLLIIALILMSACNSDDIVDRIVPINPNFIELSAEQPESYFQFSTGDYPMCVFDIHYDEKAEPFTVKITKEITQNEQYAVALPDGSKAMLYCKNGEIEKITFGFMTLSKVEKGKYKVQYNQNTNQQIPSSIDFGFMGPDGVSGVFITFK